MAGSMGSLESPNACKPPLNPCHISPTKSRTKQRNRVVNDTRQGGERTVTNERVRIPRWTRIGSDNPSNA